jgi:hypothetical protein
MSETIKETIKELQGQLRALEEEALQLKNTINLLCKRAHLPAIYPDALVGTGGLADIRADTFYGQPLNGCIRDYLDRRKTAGLGPASVREIYESLVKGGFQFNAKSEENAQRSLRITLSKSTHTFHRLPDGSFGLLSWYPTAKAAKPADERDDEVSEEGEAKSDEPVSDGEDQAHPRRVRVTLAPRLRLNESET